MMKPFAPLGVLILTTLAFSLSGCGGGGGSGSKPTATATPSPATPTPARTATPPPTATRSPGGELDIAVCAPSAGPFSANIDNPFFPLPVGAQWAFAGVDDEGAPVRVVITALAATEVVAGVTTRVVEEREWEDGALVEVSRNFFAQTADGTVCYYGEDVDDYEAGAIVGHGGAWRAGVDGALPGIQMPASPALGQTFAEEVAVGVAQDRAEVIAVGESTTVGLGTFTDTIRFLESSPLDSGTSDKTFARGVGLLVDAPVERIPMSLTFCGTNDGQGCAPDSARVDLAAPSFSNPTAVTNPLFPISQLHSVILLGTVDGEPFRSEVTLLPTRKRITLGGREVMALESQYVAFLDGRLEEVALDWYAQDDTGAVWYLGEDVFNYADGELADTGGTWLAGRDGPAAMFMPANPQIGDTSRPENIPGLVFEEVTVRSLGQTVAGPYGAVAGAIEVEELHLAPPNEDKTFAPGYGEFFTGGGGDSEALALAVPTDALSTPLPAALATLTDGAYDVFGAAGDADWATAASVVASMRAAWEGYRAGPAAALLAEQLEAALASLEEEVAAEAAVEARQAAIDVARAGLDFHLRHRAPSEVDRARFALWADQILVDVDEEDGAALRGDLVTLEWVLRRFAHTLTASQVEAVNGLLDGLGIAIDEEDLDGAAEIADQLRGALGA